MNLVEKSQVNGSNKNILNLKYFERKKKRLVRKSFGNNYIFCISNKNNL